MFMNEILLTTIVSGLSGLAGLWYGAKKHKLDVQTQSLQNIQSQIAIYETIIDKLREEIGVLITKVDEQQKTIYDLENKMELMMSKKTRAKVG